MNWFIQPPIGLAVLCALLIAGIAYAMHWLTVSGAISTFVVGFVVFGWGGGNFAVPLLVFFVTSSLLSKLGRTRKVSASQGDAKSATRDAWQVWANGGVPVLLVLVFHFYAKHWSPDKIRLLLMLYLAALATVNADTWATEIGKLAKKAPLALRNLKPTLAGESGAVSGLGLLGGLLGALAIPLSSVWFWKLNLAELLAVAWAAFLGSLIDSVLGASVQAQYRDSATGTPTERASSGAIANKKTRGLAWVNNDMVNFLASAGGVFCAWLMLRYGVYPYF